MSPRNTRSIRVIYIGAIKGVLRTSEDFVTLDGDKRAVIDVLKVLSELHGKKFADLVFDGEGINPAVNVFVNGISLARTVDFLGDILDNDVMEIALVSQAAGG